MFRLPRGLFQVEWYNTIVATYGQGGSLDTGCQGGTLSSGRWPSWFPSVDNIGMLPSTQILNMYGICCHINPYWGGGVCAGSKSQYPAAMPYGTCIMGRFEELKLVCCGQSGGQLLASLEDAGRPCCTNVQCLMQSVCDAHFYIDIVIVKTSSGILPCFQCSHGNCEEICEEYWDVTRLRRR